MPMSTKAKAEQRCKGSGDAVRIHVGADGIQTRWVMDMPIRA